MNNALIEKILLFLAGSAVGTFGTWMVLKKKYEKDLDEEIEEIRESMNKGYSEFKKKFDEDPDDESEDDEEYDEEDAAFLRKVSDDIVGNAARARDKENVRDILEKKGYTNYSRTKDEPTRNPEIPEEPEPDPEDIFVIAPEEYGEFGDYEQETLYYLRDKMLVDSDGNIVEDVSGMIGHDALNEFGAYGEPDSVYVRNTHAQMDIAIYLRENETLANFSG